MISLQCIVCTTFFSSLLLDLSKITVSISTVSQTCRLCIEIRSLNEIRMRACHRFPTVTFDAASNGNEIETFVDGRYIRMHLCTWVWMRSSNTEACECRLYLNISSSSVPCLCCTLKMIWFKKLKIRSQQVFFWKASFLNNSVNCISIRLILKFDCKQEQSYL